MRIKGLEIGGRFRRWFEDGSLHAIPLLSYHNPKQMCWLWYLELKRSVADEKRAFRYFRMPGAQDRRVLQFWSWSLVFCWQAQGRSTSLRSTPPQAQEQ